MSGADQRYSADCRLRPASAFDAVFAARRSRSSPHFRMHYRSNEVGMARLGLVVAKRQAPTAVARNLVRRLARESFRLLRRQLGAVDVVIRLSAPPKAQRAALRAELDGLLRGLAS